MTDGSIKIDNIRGKVSGISYGSSGSLSADVINIQGNLTIVINNPTQEVISDLKRIQQVPLQIVDTSTTSNTTQDSKETRQSIELFKKLLLKGDDKTGTPMHSIKAGNVEISRDELLTKDAGTMAYEYIMRGDYNNGLEWLNKAIQIDPNNATTWYNKGVALERLGRYTEAIQSYDTALQFYPFYVNAWEGKGIWETRDTNEVLNDWNKVYYLFYDSLKSLDINVAAFSDTLIISMRKGREMGSWRLAEIFCEAIIPLFLKSMEYEFFFRGAVAMGYFSRSSRMLIGPAADEAAEFYEAYNWVGICISPNTGLILDRDITQKGSRNFLVKYNIPQKTTTSIGWSLNWTSHIYDNKHLRILMNKRDKYLSLRDYSKYFKYKNSLDFFYAVTNNIE